MKGDSPTVMYARKNAQINRTLKFMGEMSIGGESANVMYVRINSEVRAPRRSFEDSF